MEKNTVRKGLVFGIIILFVGASFTTSISGDLSKVNNILDVEVNIEKISKRDTIYVDDDNTAGPWNGTQTHPYQYIQDGVNAANPGDTVFVYGGTYYEYVGVSKSINLIGEDKDTTIVNAGGGGTPSCFRLNTEWITVSGFTTENSDNGGVEIRSNYCYIYDNNILNNRYGVVFRGISCYNLISGNNISSNSIGIHSYITTISCNNNIISGNTIKGDNSWGWSFYLTDCNNFTISDNIISSYSNPNAGLRISSCNNFTISGNIIVSNYYGVHINGICNDINVSGNTILNNSMGIHISHPSSRGNILSGNNIVNSSIGIYAYQTTNNTISGNTISNSDTGISIRESTNCTILGNAISNNYRGIIILIAFSNNVSGNTVSNNTQGIFITATSSNNILYGNTVSNNELGIYLYYMYGSIDDNTLFGNTIVNNVVGINLRQSSNNIISSNTILNNTYGINASGTDNLIFNNFFNNTNNVYSAGYNIWNITKTSGTNIIGGPYLGGNFWSDYNGSDVDGDGLGDTPYIIDYNDQDNHPLVIFIDNVLPEIYNVTANPNTQNIGDYVNISAIVIDNIEVDEVYLYILYPDMTDENLSITQNRTGDTYYCNKTYYQPGIYTYHIWANDTSSNANVSADYTFEIINQPPYIPSNPIPEDNATDVPIANLTLIWSGGDPDVGDILQYDVYFGDTPNPPLFIGIGGVPYNQTPIEFELYIHYELEYDTTYFWKIKAWDNHGAFAEGPTWSFTTEEAPVPDLDCDGSLSWVDVSPGGTVTGNFTVENIGESGSLLDWEIDNYPDWGIWTFTPSSGDDLKPEDGPVTVGVTVIAPNQQNTEFTGNVTIFNKENSSDFCTIDVSLATPVSQPSHHSQYFNIHSFIKRLML